MPIPVLIPQNPLTPTDGLLKKNLLTYRSANINNPADSEDDTYIIENIAEGDQFSQGIEPLPDRMGSQVYQPYNMFKIFRIQGWVRAPSMSKLYDKIENINEKFHPERAYASDTAGTYNRGYRALTFDVPTVDTTNYATGLITSKYYVQALSLPVGINTKFEGLSARIDFSLRAADPRRYWGTTETIQRLSNGTKDAVNTLASLPSWPLIVITIAGAAPSGNLTIQRTSPSATGLITIAGASLTTSTVYNLDLQARTFKTSGGTDKISLVDGASNFFDIAAGTTSTIDFQFAGGWPASAVIDLYWTRAFI